MPLCSHAAPLVRSPPGPPLTRCMVHKSRGSCFVPEDKGIVATESTVHKCRYLVMLRLVPADLNWVRACSS